MFQMRTLRRGHRRTACLLHDPERQSHSFCTLRLRYLEVAMSQFSPAAKAAMVAKYPDIEIQ